MDFPVAGKLALGATLATGAVGAAAEAPEATIAGALSVIALALLGHFVQNTKAIGVPPPDTPLAVIHADVTQLKGQITKLEAGDAALHEGQERITASLQEIKDDFREERRRGEDTRLSLERLIGRLEKNTGETNRP